MFFSALLSPLLSEVEVSHFDKDNGYINMKSISSL